MAEGEELFVVLNGAFKVLPPVCLAGGIRVNTDGSITDLYAQDRARRAFYEEVMAALPDVTAQEIIAAVGEKRARHGGSSVP